MNKDRRVAIVRTGHWTYDGTAQGHVRLVRQNWDHYHAEFYDEPPDLNEDGFVYYLIYGLHPDVEKATSRSQSYLSEDEVMEAAPSLLSNLRWNPNSGDGLDTHDAGS